MDFNYIFNDNKLDEKKLSAYGFKQKNKKYILKKNLKGGSFYAIIFVSNKTFEVKVYDSLNDEEYIPFNIKTSTGSFVGEIRSAVDTFIDEIIEKCFINQNIKKKLLDYVLKKYGTKPISPWEDYPTYITLNAENKKWYGLIMNIPYKLIADNKEGNVEVINIKLEPDKIESLIDYSNFFPAYHMNKKYWITILLNSDIAFEQITDLIDESYNLVYKKKGKK